MHKIQWGNPQATKRGGVRSVRFRGQIKRRRIRVEYYPAEDAWLVTCRRRRFSFPRETFTREQVLNMFRRWDGA